jgi:hypothetical protein
MWDQRIQYYTIIQNKGNLTSSVKSPQMRTLVAESRKHNQISTQMEINHKHLMYILLDSLSVIENLVNL